MSRKGITITEYPGREEKSFRHALLIFKESARRVPAYKDFLAKEKIDPEKIKTKKDFSYIPPTDKSTYTLAYKLEDLSWDGSLVKTKFISSSSGSTGVPLYWPRGDSQDEIVNKIFLRIYEDIFNTRKGKTLFINLFALGTWIAGFEFYNAAKFTADSGNVIAISTPGSEKSTAIETVIRLASSFDRLVLAGYPPFLKDVLESGAHEGIVWKDHDVRLISGGESFSERWRSAVLGMVGQEKSLSHFINIYGMAETGVVGHETPLSIHIRKNADNSDTLRAKLLHEGEIAAIYQYDPMKRYLEIGADKTVMLTSDSGLPLIRYNTRDEGGTFGYDDVKDFLEAASDSTHVNGDIFQSWKGLPFVYLLGRRDMSISLYALNIYVENIKLALETSIANSLLSGFFTMRVGYTRDLNQQFEITIELARGVEPSSTISRQLASHIVTTLKKINSEYAKLSSMIGRRAHPKIRLVRYGRIETIPGRKHKWVKLV